MVNNTDLRDIVKGSPKGVEAIQRALVGAARDQEAVSKQSELDEILHQLLDSQFNPLKRQETINVAKQAILDWHNKQVEEVLDRLEQVHRANPLWVNMTQRAIPLSALEAERNKLKESK